MINPYTANASAKATTKNALKKDSSRSESEEMAAVPTVFIAQALPNTDAATASAADIAKAIVVGELKYSKDPWAATKVTIPLTLKNTIKTKKI